MIGRGRRARRRARRGHGPRRPGRAAAGPGAVVGLAPAPPRDDASPRAPAAYFTSFCFDSTPGVDRPASRERFAMTLNAPPRPLEPEAFNDLVDAAARSRRGAAGAAALAMGLDLQGLCRFAAGAVRAEERRQVEAQLASTPWATSRVSALLVGARGSAHGGLARGVLEAARNGQVDAAREVGAALVREAGDGDAPKARAGDALRAGRFDDARAALAQVERPTPLVELARRVAQLERDPDMALCELLELV